jgi:hypothetical protein
MPIPIHFRPQEIFRRVLLGVTLTSLIAFKAQAQEPSLVVSSALKDMPKYKNIVRYNLSGALLFGFDKYIVLGYERVIKPRQSASINIGKASLPKFISINTDSFNLSSDKKNTGFNVSVDYRFYLARENRYKPPAGLYIGPYYSFTQFKRTNDWNFKNSGVVSSIQTDLQLGIHTVGFELGYQFILWKRMSLDLCMVGPGVGFYKVKADINTNLNDERKAELLDALNQLLSQKVPGMNYVFSDKHFEGNGTMNTTAFGFRYLFQIGFLF